MRQQTEEHCHVSAVTKVMAVLKLEFLSILPPTIYFLMTFNIVSLTTSLVLGEFKIHVASHASATILALLVAKVVLVVDKLSFVRRFDRKPLVYPVLLKAVAYSTFVLAFRLLEYWVLGEGIVWRFLAMSQIWIIVLFVIYFTFTELVAAFGLSKRDLSRAFFHARPQRATTAT